MPADRELDPLDSWLHQQVQPLPPPPGTFELITRRARRRKTRRAVLSVASAAAVAAAIGVIVPLSTTLHLSTTSAGNNVAAAGSVTPGKPESQSPLGQGTQTPASAASPATSAAPGNGAEASTGPLPADYVPSSVTWDSTSTGWVLGPAGTPGHCDNANPSICTSIARTDDGGLTWRGLPAPSTTDVTGLRFLNSAYGWAYGPQLWATDDGGDHWHQVGTGTLSVPQLETVNGRAYALFADCTAIGANPDAACTSYTLKTATAGSDNWTAVGGVPGDLTGGAADLTAAAGQQDAAILALAGPTGTQPATGYLVAPDGTLYAGPLDGAAWHKVAALPCTPGPGNGSGGQPQALQLTPDATSSSGAARLAMVCTQTAAGGGATSVYQSNDGGTTWTERAGVSSMPATSVPQSLTALPDGTLVLAAVSRGGGTGGGIYLLSPGATRWTAAALSGSPGWNTPVGFTYVGMTSAAQGVALSSDPSQHAIWMTVNGGQTWEIRPIQG
jgi:hypothetical protein